MNSQPKISVIVPVYKVEKFLDRCVESIVGQTYKNLEIILVDDGSPDNCPAMCDSWAKKDGRIKVIHKENGGASSARNVGLKVASGDYISFVDSDDWIDSGMYEFLYKNLQKYDADISYGGISYNYDDGTQFDEGGYYLSIYKNMNEAVIHVTSTNLYATLVPSIYKKSVIQGCSFNEGLKMGEDWLFNYHVRKKMTGCEVMENKAYYHYYVNPESAMHSGMTKEKIMNYVYVANYFWENEHSNKKIYNQICNGYIDNMIITINYCIQYGYENTDWYKEKVRTCLTKKKFLLRAKLKKKQFIKYIVYVFFHPIYVLAIRRYYKRKGEG